MGDARGRGLRRRGPVLAFGAGGDDRSTGARTDPRARGLEPRRHEGHGVSPFRNRRTSLVALAAFGTIFGVSVGGCVPRGGEETATAAVFVVVVVVVECISETNRIRNSLRR